MTVITCSLALLRLHTAECACVWERGTDTQTKGEGEMGMEGERRDCKVTAAERRRETLLQKAFISTFTSSFGRIKKSNQFLFVILFQRITYRELRYYLTLRWSRIMLDLRRMRLLSLSEKGISVTFTNGQLHSLLIKDSSVVHGARRQFTQAAWYIE